jgi:hypothetical protein
MATVLTLDEAATLPGVTALQLRGQAWAGNTITPIIYNNLGILDVNVDHGVSQLDTALHNTAGAKIVVGFGLGAMVISKWLEVHGPTSDIPIGDVEFVCLGNPMRRYGGLLMNPTVKAVSDYNPWPLITAHPAPVNTPYTVTDFARQYDGIADVPETVTSTVCILNGAAGYLLVHPLYYDVGLDDSTNWEYVEGNITYILSPTYPLPLAGPWLNSLSLAADDYLRPIIEADFNRPMTGGYTSVEYLLHYPEDFAVSIEDTFKTLLCEAYTTHVDHLSLHTGDPGSTGANDSAVPHAALEWSDAADGLSTALAELSGITGDLTHIGLWEGATFRQGIPCPISYTATVDLAILVTHRVEQ